MCFQRIKQYLYIFCWESGCVDAKVKGSQFSRMSCFFLYIVIIYIGATRWIFASCVWWSSSIQPGLLLLWLKAFMLTFSFHFRAHFSFFLSHSPYTDFSFTSFQLLVSLFFYIFCFSDDFEMWRRFDILVLHICSPFAAFVVFLLLLFWNTRSFFWFFLRISPFLFSVSFLSSFSFYFV